MQIHKEHGITPFSKLTLTNFERVQPHLNPIEEWHANTLVALALQITVLDAATKGQTFTVTKSGWARVAS